MTPYEFRRHSLAFCRNEGQDRASFHVSAERHCLLCTVLMREPIVGFFVAQMGLG